MTIKLLGMAKERLSTNYMGVIRNSFSDYLHRVTGEAAENIFVNPQLDIRLERRGETRDIGYFSAGQADIIMLCMRMALVRALFKEEKPFIVLDDPFINLDDERTTEALALLDDLAEEYQIIYLICNSSRTSDEEDTTPRVFGSRAGKEPAGNTGKAVVPEEKKTAEKA